MKAFISLIFCALLASFTAASRHGSLDAVDWQGWGGSIFNNRWAYTNTEISSHSIKNLTTHCKIPHTAGVSATPTLLNGTAYYPTWAGSYVALDYKTCSIKWQVNVTDIIIGFAPLTSLQKIMSSSPLFANPFSSRSSAQIDTQHSVLYFTTIVWALAVAVDLNDGKLLNVIQMNPHQTALGTLSPTLYNGILYAGAASIEEGAPGVPGYVCCSFVGNAVALKFDRALNHWFTVWNVTTLPIDGAPGKINSRLDDAAPKSPLVPTAGGRYAGWAGGGVWGSQPAIDPIRNRVFFATGNTYHTPPEYIHCTDEVFDPANATQGSTCLPDRVWQNSVLALDLDTGRVAWVRRFGPADVWTVACGGLSLTDKDPKNCPGTPGPDYDFGMAPSFVPAGGYGSQGGRGKKEADMLTIGQKSGLLYGIAAKDGKPLWSTITSPGGVQGGLTWGAATDDERVYFAGVNSGLLNFTIPLPGPTTVINKGLFGAADVKSGKLLWEVPVPLDQYTISPPTVVGDVVLFSRLSFFGFPAVGDGALVVLDKKNGSPVLDYPVEGAFRGGIAVQDDFILFGTGYKGGNGFLYVLRV